MSVLEIVGLALVALSTAAIVYSFFLDNNDPEKAAKYQLIGGCLIALMGIIFFIDYVI